MNETLSIDTIRRLGGKAVKLGVVGQKHVHPVKRVERRSCDGKRIKVCVPRSLQDFYEEFWAYVDVREDNECWLCLRKWKDHSGHRVIHLPGPQTKKHATGAHRVAWMSFYGTIPNGLFVLHSCDVAPCCNPFHLFLGTHLDNAQDCVAKNRRLPGILKTSKLKIEDVKQIRLMKASHTYKELAVRYSVHWNTIREAVKGTTWKRI